MTEKAPAKDGQKKAEKTIVVKKQVIAGALVVLAILAALAAYGLWGRNSDPAAPGEAPLIGTFDMQQMMRQHKEYTKLQSLEQEIGQLSSAMAVQEMQLDMAEKMKLPEVNEKAFQDATEQKQRLDEIERHSQLMEEINALAAEQRKLWQPGFNAELAEAARPFENQMLNLRLKIDNAEVLGLNQSQVEAMLDEIDQLQQERGIRLEEIRSEQDKRFRAMMEELAGPKLAELESITAKSRQQLQQSELERQLQAQERNTQAMQRALSPIQQRLARAKNEALLEAKKLQVQQLQAKIRNDIAGRAAKLAIMHHLMVVLADPGENVTGLLGDMLQMNQRQLPLSSVLRVNTLDLTDEMLQEMKTL